MTKMRYEATYNIPAEYPFIKTRMTDHLQSALDFIGEHDGTIIDHTEGITYTRKDFEQLNEYLLLG